MRKFYVVPAFLALGFFCLLYADAGGPLTPTQSQLQWQKSEIMALIHFNMATFFRNGDPGCGNMLLIKPNFPNPGNINPF